jgi:hypothetical protein
VGYYVLLLESSRGNFGFEKRIARYGTRSCPGLTIPSVKKFGLWFQDIHISLPTHNCVPFDDSGEKRQRDGKREKVQQKR